MENQAMPVLFVVHLMSESGDNHYVKVREQWPQHDEAEQVEVLRRAGPHFLELDETEGCGMNGTWYHVQCVVPLFTDENVY
jgi:hypothetical protein